MSNALMTLAWRLDLPATEKMVLVALADRANAETGMTWLAIRSLRGSMDLITMTSLSERSIQGAIKSLAAAGHITRTENIGRGVTYTVHPRNSCTPAADAPPQQLRPAGDAPTPAAAAPKPSLTLISSDAKASSVKPRAPRLVASSTFPCPDGVDPTHWADLLANRKSKRLTNTATAYAGLLREISRLSDDEWPPGRIVQHAAERGWGAIFDPRERNGTRNGKRPHHDRPSAWSGSHLPLGAVAADLDQD